MRTLLICAVLAAAGAGIASASGLAGRLFDVVAREPEPARVQRHVDLPSRRAIAIRWFQQQRESQAIASKTHGVLAIETSAGPVYVWVAPTRGGGFCQVIDIEANTLPDGSPNLSGICRPQVPRRGRPFVAGPVLGSTFTARGELHLLHGRVSSRAALVDIRFESGDVATVRPVEGFYLREVSVEPTAVIARDANGSELGRRPMPGPRSFRRDLAFPIGPYRKLIEIETSAGFPLSFAVAPGTNGSVCERTLYRGRQAWGCGQGSTRLAPDAIAVHRGIWNEHRRPLVLLQGAVGSAISRLEVWYEDRSAARLPIVEQYVLFEVPRARVPRVLVGLDANGSIVARRPLRRR
jgi:hypothetical protein